MGHRHNMRELVHIQGGQCGNQIGAKFWEVISDEHVSTQLVPTTVTLTFSWSASTFTTTRPLAVATCLVPSLWTLSQVLWTRSVLAHSVSSSAQITSSSARLALATTGPRVTTPRALS